uniref:Uncharacterized protein n=1 Tax=Vespula pensylvanica TaxID=30213 RepID=A0A834KSF0_VESPE|nr:hypothetical protein H0235_013065 [Vespula pensylvanica]
MYPWRKLPLLVVQAQGNSKQDALKTVQRCCEGCLLTPVVPKPSNDDMRAKFQVRMWHCEQQLSLLVIS